MSAAKFCGSFVWYIHYILSAYSYRPICWLVYCGESKENDTPPENVLEVENVSKRYENVSTGHETKNNSVLETSLIVKASAIFS